MIDSFSVDPRSESLRMGGSIIVPRGAETVQLENMTSATLIVAEASAVPGMILPPFYRRTLPVREVAPGALFWRVVGEPSVDSDTALLFAFDPGLVCYVFDPPAGATDGPVFDPPQLLGSVELSGDTGEGTTFTFGQISPIYAPGLARARVTHARIVGTLSGGTQNGAIAWKYSEDGGAGPQLAVPQATAMDLEVRGLAGARALTWFPGDNTTQSLFAVLYGGWVI